MSEQTPHERNIYLHDVALDAALDNWHAALQELGLWGPLGVETIPLDQALGRVTAEPVWARISSPHYHAAAMDGYAVRSDETRAAPRRRSRGCCTWANRPSPSTRATRCPRA